MWGSKVTRDQLLQKISLLAILGPIRDGHRDHSLVSTQDQARSLTIDQEAEIVRNLSFLSCRRKDSRTVVALGIEEHEDGQGMTIRWSVNGNNVSHVEEGLQQICATLEKVSQRKSTETHDVELLCRKVVKLDFSRISARLRLAKRYRVEASPIMQLQKIFLRDSVKRIESSKIEELRSQLAIILTLYRRLKGDPQLQQNQSALEAMEQIIKSAHHINRCPEFVIALQDLSGSNTSQVEPFIDLISKLGQYYKASVELVAAARRKRYRLFERIQIKDFKLRVPDVIRSPSTRDSAQSLMKTLRTSPNTSKVFGRFQNSESKAAAALIRRVNSTRSGIKVHAEIKLLFYYEVHSKRIKPRVICANKSACYLCDLFLRIHGRFQVPMTFGKLNERWVLPDWLDDVQPDRVPALKTAVEQFDAVLDAQVRRLLNGVKRMPDPKESAIGLPAYWSVSSVENYLKHDRNEATAENHGVSTLLPESPGSTRASGISYQGPKLSQIRSSANLDDLYNQQDARTIEGHGSRSRSCEALSEHGIPGASQLPHFGVEHSGSVSCKIDFHDLELFIEVEHPATARLLVVRYSTPPHLMPDSFIDIDTLNIGEELMLNSTKDSEERRILLRRKDRSGTKRWWKIYWNADKWVDG